MLGDTWLLLPDDLRLDLEVDAGDGIMNALKMSLAMLSSSSSTTDCVRLALQNL